MKKVVIRRLSQEETRKRREEDLITPQSFSEPAQDPAREKSWILPLPGPKRPKRAISLRIDQDVLAFFKQQGPGYQTRINAVLRAFMDAHRED